MDTPQGITALSGVLLGLVTVTVGLRFYARSLQKSTLGPDDWTVLPAYIAYAGVCGLVFASVRIKFMGYAAGQSTEPPRVSSAIDTAFLTLDDLCLGLTKISALFFYKRIFIVSKSQRIFNYVLNASIVFIAAWTIVYVTLPPLQCQGHFGASWNPVLKKKYCTITVPFAYSNVITDVILEAYVILLPIIPVWRIRTSLKRRLAIIFVFLTALASFGGSIGRAIMVFLIFQKKLAGDANLLDTKMFFLWILETGFALLCVNMPTLHYLYARHRSRDIFFSIRSKLSRSSLGTSSSASAIKSRKSSASDAQAGLRSNSSDVESGALNAALVPGKGTSHETSIVAIKDATTRDDARSSPGMIQVVSSVTQEVSQPSDRLES